MSGGEQQMVAVGRALMSDPTILMLDEPSLGLSPLLSKELFQALGRIRETGPGVLVVEQNAKLSLAIADRGYLIENGRIVGANDAVSLAADPAVQAAYLGGKPGRAGAPAARTPAAAPKQAGRAPAAAEAAAATGSGRVYVQPAGLSGGAMDTGALIGENLDSLLGRANAAARPSSTVTTAQPAGSKTGPRAVKIKPEPERAAPAPAPERTVPGQAGAAGDERIAALLADFEIAAQKAREPRANGGTNAPDYTIPHGGEPDGLPEIPVFRKAKVEVFKRDKNGALVKAREA